MGTPLLQVEQLQTYFDTYLGRLKAVDGVSFSIQEREILGLVGESGCGKSVTALSILRLIKYPGRIVGGRVFLRGKDILQESDAYMQKLRGKEISMIFQDPLSSLNPVLKVGFQISEVFRFHQGLPRNDSRTKSVEMMEMVGIPSPEARVSDYPHQFSGGMRQRIMTAMALSCIPALLIADEPTTALDVTIQAQILSLISELSKKFGTSILLITHNLGIIARYADRVGVMYAGKIVEIGDVKQIFQSPLHPYTRGLLTAIPKIGHKERLSTIPGTVPVLIGDFPGCRFCARCDVRMSTCEKEEPQLVEVESKHSVSCHQYG